MGRYSDDSEEEDRRRRDRKRRKRSRTRSRSRSRSPRRRRKSRSRSRSPKRRSDRDRDRDGSDEDRRKRDRRDKDRHRDRDKDRKERKRKKEKEKKRRRSSSSSSSSSAGSDSSTELLRRLETERKQLKEKRKMEKERIKATETPEEKRARRLLKKELKAMRNKERTGWADEEYARYTNDDNPFGDSNLTQTFRWNKKLQKEGLDKLDERDLDRVQRQRQEEQRLELEKVKMARLQREKEREERQELLEMQERSRENEKFSKWQQQEDEFHLQQARMRSKIRIQDGRAKPIDLLAKYISAEEEVDAVEMHEPYTYLNGLTVGDLEDLLADIKVYQDIDLDKNREFWADIIVIVDDELAKLRKMDSRYVDSPSVNFGSIKTISFFRSQYELAAERRQGINKAVADDVQKVFEGKTAEQLTQLQSNIERKLQSRADGLDVNYWESLLSQLKAHLARARLRDKHKDNLQKKLELLKAEQAEQVTSPPRTAPLPEEEEAEAVPEVKEEESSGEDSPQPGPSRQNEEDDKSTEEKTPDNPYLTIRKRERDNEPEDPMELAYIKGNYSPVYVRQDDLELGTHVVSEEEDEARRKADRDRVLKGGKVEGVVNAEEAALEKEARKGMGGDEASFSVESALEVTYEWSDKYRPRKPRYFNRVHTGFEWNKYNQTHYDVDNPPPKIVQGYKFNIFYPDLIDKRATPQYELVPCGDNSDFCVLRIHAGPPYEDIAFKIVNREWEFGYKRGFKCQFHNNIFQLWFHFKRLRYRR